MLLTLYHHAIRQLGLERSAQYRFHEDGIEIAYVLAFGRRVLDVTLEFFNGSKSVSSIRIGALNEETGVGGNT